ncbi:hypothetical protein L596_003385 [Steinernema carpocapsae]|uniref:Uncharacterized protein n=2 Tax=Steinernema carpocapsae TaxID=34508 RepID=A0A4U8US60_STECR|nr:hypothetical protein L596_003385 [Steinernema carpocapsae]
MRLPHRPTHLLNSLSLALRGPSQRLLFRYCRLGLSGFRRCRRRHTEHHQPMPKKSSDSIVECSSKRSAATDTTVPPSAKKRRMQFENQTASTGRSVGQRLKEAARKDGFKDSKQVKQLRSPQQGNRYAVEPIRTFPDLTDVQKNTVRVIGQYLSDLGLRDTVDSLVQETGCQLERSLAARLRDCVNRGLWNKALDIVDKISAIASERQCMMVRVLLLEEKFKELLRINQPVMAVRLLHPRWEKLKKRRDFYSQMVITYNPKTSPPLTEHELKRRNKELLSRIHLILPLNFMLPPSRLEDLLNQAWRQQVSNCSLHLMKGEPNARPASILRDHRCSFAQFPVKSSQVLRDHHDEVWSLRFSPCGRLLASGTKGGQVNIWKVDPLTRRVSLQKSMSMGGFGVMAASVMSWSPDGKFVAVTGTEDNHTGVVVFNVHVGALETVIRAERGETFSSICFGNSHNYSVACADQKGHFYYCDIKRSSPPRNSFDGYRIRSLHCMKDGKTILAADTHNRIRSYRIDNGDEATIIQEFKTIICFSLDKREHFCLVTAKAEGLRLWDLRTRQFIRTFFGSIHGEYVIFPTFGGDQEHFIATGSEDNKVLVWNKEHEQPIKILAGHTGTVNAVSWNPRYHDMLASASDDGTVRIWTPETR